MSRPSAYSGFLTCAALSLLLAGLPLQACAEALDDASIRKFYADDLAVENNADKTKDATKLQAFLKIRLDEGYTITTSTIDIVNGGTPENGKESYNKTQAITNVADNLNMMDTDKSDDKVTNIKYSGDHKYAYATTTSISSGTLHGPGPDGHPLILRFKDDQSCVDKIGLEETILKIMQSTCTDKLVTEQ